MWNGTQQFIYCYELVTEFLRTIDDVHGRRPMENYSSKMFLLILFASIGIHCEDTNEDVRLYNSGIVLTKQSKTLLHSNNFYFPLKVQYFLPTFSNFVVTHPDCEFEKSQAERFREHVNHVKNELLETIHFYLGDADQGIVHVIGPELGITQP